MIGKLNKKTKIILIAVAGAIVLAGIIIGIVLGLSGVEKPLTAAELLDLGEKYLLELDYEQALVQFLAVIEIEPRNADAYTGAADAYIGLGELDKAADILRQGLEALPDNAEIEEKLREVERMQSSLSVTPTPTATPAPPPTPSPTPIPTPTLEPTRISVSGHEIIEFGGYDWLVLEVQDGRALLLSEKILENRAYHDGDRDDWGRGVDITWADSDMRAYLNGGFYNSFSAEDRVRVTQVTNSNPDNPWFGTEGGVDTQDSIFLLSLDEVVHYFGDSGDLANRRGWRTDWDTGDYVQGVHTDDDWYWDVNDQYNENRIAYSMDGGTPYWWLRTPGGCFGDMGEAVGIMPGGVIGISGYGYGVGGDSGGVRPALWLKLET